MHWKTFLFCLWRLQLALLVFELGAPVSASASRPNVLFLCVDDMRDWINCMGGYAGTVHTPNIDRLAARGVLFTNAHCPSPKCAPSRAAIMTGLRPSTTGLYDNGHWWKPNLPDVVTIPEYFRRHGYYVAGAGKVFHHTAGNNPPDQWHEFQRLEFKEDPWFRGVRLNYPWSKHSANPPGFPFSGVKGLGHENDWGALPIDDAQYDDALTANYAIRFLKNFGDRKSVEDKQSTPAGDNRNVKPFFLACGLFRPHLPWYVPQKYFDLYDLDDVVLPEIKDDDLDDLPSEGLRFAAARRGDFQTITKANRWKHAVRAYLAAITCADDRVGQILEALDESGLASQTIVVLWSDHGWHLGEKQHWHKSTLWEEATRVPLIICGPEIDAATCSRPVSLLDIFPTLNHLAGLPPVNSHEGVSLVPLLEAPHSRWHRPAVIEYRRGNAAVRTERFRYIRYHDGGEELYDHSVDSQEWNNLADNPLYKNDKAKLRQWLPKSWAKSAPTKKAFSFDHENFTWRHLETGEVIHGK